MLEFLRTCERADIDRSQLSVSDELRDLLFRGIVVACDEDVQLLPGGLPCDPATSCGTCAGLRVVQVANHRHVCGTSEKSAIARSPEQSCVTGLSASAVLGQVIVGLRSRPPRTASARIRKPMPERRSAIPTTTLNSPICSAM